MPIGENHQYAQVHAISVQTYARIAGVLLLLTVLAGSFGEFYVPSKLIVSTDATTTANNFIAHDMLFRLGFASYLVEAVCDVSLSLIFYMLLRPVHKYLALLALCFGLVSTASFVVAQLFYFAASLIVGGADYLKTFSPDQVNTLALLSLKVSGYGGGIFMVFYGIAAIARGYLIFQSSYLPKFLGVLLTFGGLGFVTRNFVLVLAPAYASSFFLLPMMVAVLSLTSWLLVRGVDVPKWNDRAATCE